MTIMIQNKLCLCTRRRQHTNLRATDLCVSIQYFDSFSGDKQVHFCHHLRIFILAL